MLEQYQRFCANPLRNDATLKEEFEALMRVEGITRVAFMDDETMVLGTELITMVGPKTHKLYEIGEFLIFLFRKRKGRIWEVSFRFHNVTQTPSQRWKHDGSYYRTEYAHPHILIGDFPSIAVPTGTLCIQQGKFHVYQHLRKGEIHLAAPIFMQILNSYGPGRPYYPLGHWPKIGGSDAEH